MSFPKRVKRALPRPLAAPARAAYHALFRHWLRIRCRISDWSSPPNSGLPPAKLRFKVGEDLRPETFLKTGRRTAENLEAVLAECEAALFPGATVLDFGCGCGRTLRWLIPRYPAVRWYGCDVDADAIAWCQSALGGAEFETTGPLPPLPYSDASFNLIYAVSVFTHLSEGSQRAWLPELHRLLKPGGRLVVSVYGRGTWAQLAEADVVARGGFVFLESGKLKGIQPEWYQTAFQSRARLEALLGSVFPEVCYREGAFGDQDAAVARKAGAVTSPGSIASS